jgi:glucose-6-phosphate 1-epimerase
MNQILLSTDFAEVIQKPLVDDINVLDVKHLFCQAKVSLYGGQVLSYRPIYQDNSLESEAKDVFWLSQDAYYQKGKAIRGGVPLCWPWFGVNDKATQEIPSTNHGFAREVTWQVDNVISNSEEVTVVLVFQGESQHPLWPNSFKLTQTLTFGKTFKQSLSMTNLSTEDAHYSAALHSYFRVSSPSNIKVDQLTGCKFDDKLTGQENHQKTAVSCVGPIDRIYHIDEKNTLSENEQVSTVIMNDASWQRNIEVTSIGCSQWVLWNPGAEQADIMGDVHVNAEEEFVCLEAANTEWQPLLAGQTTTISQEVKVFSVKTLAS